VIADLVARRLLRCAIATRDRMTQADLDAVQLVVVPEVDGEVDGALGREWDAVNEAVEVDDG
jgi:hypothetical protein